MCGIIGVVGDAPALPVIIGGLRRLEYRGYDSAGVAVINDGVLPETDPDVLTRLAALVHERTEATVAV